MLKVSVADAVIKLDIPHKFLGENMYKFRCGDSENEDIFIGMAQGQAPVFDLALDWDSVPLHTICRSGESNYYMLSPDNYVTYFQFNNDYSHFIINLNESLRADELDERSGKILFECVNSMLRRIFIMLVAARGGVCLHSSTILSGGEAICFSASSGTGKTTHTNLWQEFIPDIEVLNGDMGYLFPKGKTAYFYSAPWCGTSGKCIAASAPVRAVVFLEQAKENALQRIGVPEIFMRLSSRCFIPAWDKNLNLKTINTAESLAGILDGCLLKCLPDIDAARVCYYGLY